jgi:hypothetical protein
MASIYGGTVGGDEGRVMVGRDRELARVALRGTRMLVFASYRALPGPGDETLLRLSAEASAERVMIGRPPSDDRLGCVPNWPQRRREARAPGHVLARLAHRHARRCLSAPSCGSAPRPQREHEPSL